MNFKAKNKVTVGLTGGILCGKSAALAAFAKCGALTLSCDELAREISARPAVQKKIKALFGTADKAELAKEVFSSPARRKELETLLHPLILREIARRLKAEQNPVRVVEVPLLFECGLQDAFDITLCVAAPEKGLLSRAKQRGMAKDDFLKRRKAQFSQTEKANRADICLLNESSLAELEGKVKNIYRAFCHIYQPK